MKNIMMDIAFTIETEKTFETLTKPEIFGALLDRIATLMNSEDWREAIGHCDEYEVEEEPRYMCPSCWIEWEDKALESKCPKCGLRVKRGVGYDTTWTGNTKGADDGGSHPAHPRSRFLRVDGDEVATCGG